MGKTRVYVRGLKRGRAERMSKIVTLSQIVSKLGSVCNQYVNYGSV